jgi:hypothetical protein
VEGVTIEYRAADGEIRGAQARVLDFDDPRNNDWLAVNQFTVTENRHTRRPDVVLFVNGLPLAVIELKNAPDEDATIWTAFQQLQTYKAELPALLAFNALLVISDGIEARVYYPRIVPDLDPYRGHPRLDASRPLDRARAAARTVLSLPVHPGLGEGDVAGMAASLGGAVAATRALGLARLISADRDFAQVPERRTPREFLIDLGERPWPGDE